MGVNGASWDCPTKRNRREPVVLSSARKCKKVRIEMRHLEGGDGNRAVSLALMFCRAIENDTDKPYDIHYGYSTVANGRADEIVVNPGEIAYCDFKGSAHSFARWRIGSKEEFPENIETRKVSFLG